MAFLNLYFFFDMPVEIYLGGIKLLPEWIYLSGDLPIDIIINSCHETMLYRTHESVTQEQLNSHLVKQSKYNDERHPKFRV